MRAALAALTVVTILAGSPAIAAPPQLPAAAQRPRPTPDPLYDGAVKLETLGLSNLIVLKRVMPAYSDEAMRLKIQGEVTVLARVEGDGTVSYVEIDRSLDAVHGLDAAALNAARSWVFRRPDALKDNPVPVVVSILMSFYTH